MQRNKCLLPKFLCCCTLRDGVSLLSYFQILFTVIELIVAFIWTQRLGGDKVNQYTQQYPSKFLIFPWISLFNQLVICSVAVFMIKKSIPHSLAHCYFWIFLIHTIFEIVFTIVEFTVGFSEVFEFTMLMLFYVFMDGYFCWTILSYAMQDYEVNNKEKRDFQIPGVRTHNPYMEEQIDFQEINHKKNGIMIEHEVAMEEKKGVEFQELSSQIGNNQNDGAFD